MVLQSMYVVDIWIALHMVESELAFLDAVTNLVFCHSVFLFFHVI